MQYDNEMKRKWVEALRSGKYTQGQNALITKTGYCCLGVLAVAVLDKEELIRGYQFIPQAFCPVGLNQQAFAIMNDQDGKSFAEIADYIESTINA